MDNRTRSRFLEILRAELGYYEKASNAYLDDKTANAGGNNFTKYARDLANAGYYQASKQGFDWCDMFFDWSFLQLCGGDPVEAQKRIYQSGPYGAGVDWSASYYKQSGRFYTSNPKPGDQIFFNDFNHTGAVEEVTATQIITIEGNANNRVERRYYPIGASCIDGFGRPDFDEEEERSYTDTICGLYKVTASGGLNLRAGASAENSIIETMSGGSYVTCYGYYTGDWYYVESQSGNIGYCHKDYLEKVMPFVDVNPSAYYFDTVRWGLENQITAGTDPTHFAPSARCTRAQAVTMLYARYGKPDPVSYEGFPDVAPTDYFAKAVQWASAKGVTAGIGDGKFGPNDLCTRGQIVTMLHAAAGRPEVGGDLPFVDVKEGDYFAKAVKWAKAKGITAGVGDGKFGANDSCTRSQIVTMLYHVR